MLSIGKSPAHPAGDNRDGVTPGAGFVKGVLSSADLAEVWNEFRIWGSAVTAIVVLALGVFWSWPGGFVIAAIAVVALVDARHRRRIGSTSMGFTVFLDMSLVGVGITVADLDPVGIGVPYIYMMAVPLLLLPLAKALAMVAYGSGWALLAVFMTTPFPLPSYVERDVVTFIAFAMFTLLLLGVIAVVGRSLERNRQFTDRKLRTEAALVTAGEGLLTNVSEASLIDALESIREATRAGVAFVAENSGDRHSGPAALVRHVARGEREPVSWTLPYMQHRAAAAELANGRSVRLDDPIATVLGKRPGTTAAVAVPVYVGGEWAGFLGIAYTELPAPEPDVRVLETFAAMIGAFIERRQAYRKLEQAVQSKDQFLASVSHEIKTPLTSVLGLAAVLGDDDGHLSEPDQRELIGMIRRESQEVADLVEDLLVAGRAEIDQVKVSQEPVHLATEIENVLKSRLGSEERDVFVASSLHHVALADPVRVRQILRNLLTNALRYGGPEITITTHRDGSEVTLVFSDNGDGIPPEHRKRIFDPYHRGQQGLSRSDSVGLGLAVSRQLARLMDGDLTLRTDLGPSTFQLTLPLAPRDPDAVDPAPGPDAVVVG